MLLTKQNIVFLIVCFCLIACRRQDTLQQTVLHGPTMGTAYTIKIVEDIGPSDKQAVLAEIEKTLAEINRSMSTYDPKSELSRWNASPSTDWFSVSPATAAVVTEAIRIGRLSEGAFDVTVDPLVRLWNFGPAPKSKNVFEKGATAGSSSSVVLSTTRVDKPPVAPLRETQKIPGPREINDALRLVGFSRLEARGDPPAVRKGIAEMQVDLSGIAKGYAVDRLADLLESRDCRNCMVEIGGEVRAAGHNLAGDAWRIAIAAPLAGECRVESVVHMDNRAMATSGDYRNYREKDGVRYSHILDPRTGSPVRHRLASVSVLSDCCAEADALATGLMVLGPEAGYKLAESQGIAANFIARSGRGFEQKRTSHWPKAEFPHTPAEQGGSNITTVLIASIVVLAASMLALSIGPVFRKKKRQCACKTAKQIMNAADNVSHVACDVKITGRRRPG